MRLLWSRVRRVVAKLALAVLCLARESGVSEATLHWPSEKRETLRVRLIAMAESDPRSSLFPPTRFL